MQQGIEQWQNLPGGSTGARMGGWFRREIRTVADFGGLKIGISGLAGQVLSRLGAVPGDIAVADVRAALESGRVDAAEWSGPHEDERLGFVAAAPYYYYPGWWQGGLQLAFFINKPAFDALPPAYRSLLGTAARAVTLDMLAEYDFQNPPALKRLVAAGAQIRPFPQPVLDACFEAANAVYADINAANPTFRTIFASMQAFRNEAFLYAQVSEYTYDTFMMIKQREGALLARSQEPSAPALPVRPAPG